MRVSLLFGNIDQALPHRRTGTRDEGVRRPVAFKACQCFLGLSGPLGGVNLAGTVMAADGGQQGLKRRIYLVVIGRRVIGMLSGNIRTASRFRPDSRMASTNLINDGLTLAR